MFVETSPIVLGVYETVIVSWLPCPIVKMFLSTENSVLLILILEIFNVAWPLLLIVISLSTFTSTGISP